MYALFMKPILYRSFSPGHQFPKQRPDTLITDVTLAPAQNQIIHSNCAAKSQCKAINLELDPPQHDSTCSDP